MDARPTTVCGEIGGLVSLWSESHFEGIGSSSDGWGAAGIMEVVDSTTVGVDRSSVDPESARVAVSTVSAGFSSGVDVEVGTGSLTGVSVNRLTLVLGRSGPMVGSIMRNCERLNESLSPTCCRMSTRGPAVNWFGTVGVVLEAGLVVSMFSAVGSVCG